MRSRKKRAFTLAELLIIVAIVALLAGVFFATASRPRDPRTGRSAQNNRQMALAAIMYGGDYDDVIPLSINGWMSRLQNRSDAQRTVNCPGPGTQGIPALDAGGAEPARTWVYLVQPYIKSRGLYIVPGRGDPLGIFSADPTGIGDPGYDPKKNTYRNQGRFPFYGMNYMFVAPIRIPKSKLNKPDPVNYAEGEARTFTGATDPSETIFFVESQRAMDDLDRGFFVINAPGMWPAFAHNKKGYIGFWNGTKGSGDWVGTYTACAKSQEPCPDPMPNHGFAWMGQKRGANASFLDGHVKYLKATAMAGGTDYMSAVAGANGDLGSGAQIVDKRQYLWDYNGNFYGL